MGLILASQQPSGLNGDRYDCTAASRTRGQPHLNRRVPMASLPSEPAAAMVVAVEGVLGQKNGGGGRAQIR